MDEKPLSPFKLTPQRIMLLVFGILLVLIGLSTALGGLASYQELKDAAVATKNAPPSSP